MSVVTEVFGMVPEITIIKKVFEILEHLLALNLQRSLPPDNNAMNYNPRNSVN